MSSIGKILIWLLMAMLFNLFVPPVHVFAKGKQTGVTKDLDDKREDRIFKIHQQLNLSPEQDKKLQALRNDHKKQLQELKESTRAKREELRKELQKQEINMEKIIQLHSELKVMIGQREDHRLNGILETRKILTPEQLTKLFDLIERDHQRLEKDQPDNEE